MAQHRPSSRAPSAAHSTGCRRISICNLSSLEIGQSLASQAGNVFAGSVNLLTQLVIMLFVLFSPLPRS